MAGLWIKAWVDDYQRMKAFRRYMKAAKYRRKIDELNAALQEGIYG